MPIRSYIRMQVFPRASPSSNFLAHTLNSHMQRMEFIQKLGTTGILMYIVQDNFRELASRSVTAIAMASMFYPALHGLGEGWVRMFGTPMNEPPGGG